MRLTTKIIILTFLVSFSSCDRLKRKGNDIYNKSKEVVSGTKQEINRKVTSVLDSVILKPYVDTPNTKQHINRFKENLLSEIPDDVKNIYSYGDYFGADYKILIAFTCEPSTINKIISEKKMKQASTDNDKGLDFGDDFTWWDTSKIQKLLPYKAGKEYEFWDYLWYDFKTKKAYFQKFSL